MTRTYNFIHLLFLIFFIFFYKFTEFFMFITIIETWFNSPEPKSWISTSVMGHPGAHILHRFPALFWEDELKRIFWTHLVLEAAVRTGVWGALWQLWVLQGTIKMWVCLLALLLCDCSWWSGSSFTLASKRHPGRSLLVYQERKEGRVKSKSAQHCNMRARIGLHICVSLSYTVKHGKSDDDIKKPLLSLPPHDINLTWVTDFFFFIIILSTSREKNAIL